MKHSFLFVLFASACLTGACSPSPSANDEKPADTEAPTHVYSEPVDRARAVEQQVHDAAEAHKRAIDDQSGGGADPDSTGSND